MNAKDAHEIISNTKISRGSVYCRCDDHILYEKADSYLAALIGEEVETLVKGIERVISECFRESEAGVVESLEDALSKYREAIKK